MTTRTGAGSIVAIATTYGTAVAMSAITNAAEAVATLAAGHGVVAGDYLEITTSGWGQLAKRIVRAKTVATNDVTLEGINTISTTQYPAGTGTGTVRRITAWTAIGAIKADSFSQSGGEQQFSDATPLDSTIQQQMPTTRSPYVVQFAVMDAGAGLTAAEAVSNSRDETAIRITSGTQITVGNGIWSVSDVPNISGNEVITRAISLSFVSQPKTY